MKRRGISKGAVFPFSSCKCAVILQPERESLAESGAAGWRGVEDGGVVVGEGTLLYFLGTKIPFHAATKKCFLFVFTARNYLWPGCLGDKCGGIAPGGAVLQFVA